ncbi:MAG: 50S ribosomal protein L17 [SAR324 cluster bacterium]|nr:50S ribosomal protein L17 [SAR324 cluster bacterium]
MRHLKAGNRLGVTTAHRRAMIRNMVTSILENGQITCTLARAKAIRKPLEKMITWGKQGDLNARRQALRFVKSKEAMSQLFEDLADRYKERQGGYSRIIKLGKNRLGDNSEMAIVQLLGSDADQLSSLKSKTSKRKQPKKKGSTVLKEVSEEVQTESESHSITESGTQQTGKKENAQSQSEIDSEVTQGNAEAEATPTEQVDVTEETNKSVEVKDEEVPAETKVVTEEIKEETKVEATTVQVDVVEEKVEVAESPTEQVDVTEETNKSVEVKDEEVPAETKVATKEETKAEVIPENNETESASEQVTIEKTSPEKKTD